MASENSSGTMSVVLVVIAILVVGLGGYFTGKVIDTKVVEEEAAAEQELAIDALTDELDVYVYINNTYDISLKYPDDWGVVESDNGFVIAGPNDSEFKYLNFEDEDSISYSCEDEDCILVSSFERFKDTELSNEDTDHWLIAENGEYVAADSFSYLVLDSGDLSELDNIMSTVERL